MKGHGTNIDPNEIEKFGKLAQHWWELDGACKPLHDINPLRLGYIREKIRLKGATVLDAGCGGGILSEAMAMSGARVTGIDMSAEGIAAACIHAAQTGSSADYRQMTVEQAAFLYPERFDAVTCMELLEHVPDPESVIRACRNLVRPGGSIFLATLNRNFKSFVFAIIGAEYILRLLDRGTHQYSRFVRPSEIRCWAEKAGLAVMDFTGLQYNPFTRRYFLNRDTSVNYMVHLKRL